MHNLNTTLFFAINNLSGHWPLLDRVFLFITNPLIFIVIGIAATWIIFIRPFYKKDPVDRLRAIRDELLFITVMGLVWFISALLKSVVAFPRPQQYFQGIRTLLVYGDFDSFPSLHAAFSFALAYMVSSRNARLGGVLFIIAVLVGISRVFVGVHFPIDIIVGAIIGILVPWCINTIIRR